MSQEPEQVCTYKVKELLLVCPKDIKRLLEKCYITIYNEDPPLPSLFGTVYIPDSLLFEVESQWNFINSIANQVGVVLCHVEISKVFKHSSTRLQQFQKSRPRHYLEMLYLLK